MVAAIVNLRLFYYGLNWKDLRIDPYIRSFSSPTFSHQMLFIFRQIQNVLTTSTWLRSWHFLKHNKNSLIKSKSEANFIRRSLNAGIVYEPVMDLASQQGSSGLRDKTTQIIHYLSSLIRRWQKKLIMNHGNKLELFFSLCRRSHCQLMFAELWVWSLWGRRTTSLQAVISCVLSLSALISCPLLACEISVVLLFVANANQMWGMSIFWCLKIPSINRKSEVMKAKVKLLLHSNLVYVKFLKLPPHPPPPHTLT